MSKVGWIVLLSVVVSALTSALTSIAFDMRPAPTVAHGRDVLDPSTKILALDFNFWFAKASAKTTADGVELRMQLHSTMYNRGEEPLYLRSVSYLANSFNADNTCFEAGTTSPEGGLGGPIQIAPKQIAVIDIDKIYKRKWRDPKKRAYCTDHGYMEAEIETSYGYYRSILFEPLYLDFDKEGEVATVAPLASVSEGAISGLRSSPAIFVETEPFKNRHPGPDLEPQIEKAVLSLYPRK